MEDLREDCWCPPHFWTGTPAFVYWQGLGSLPWTTTPCQCGRSGLANLLILLSSSLVPRISQCLHLSIRKPRTHSWLTFSLPTLTATLLHPNPTHLRHLLLLPLSQDHLFPCPLRPHPLPVFLSVPQRLPNHKYHSHFSFCDLFTILSPKGPLQVPLQITVYCYFLRETEPGKFSPSPIPLLELFPSLKTAQFMCVWLCLFGPTKSHLFPNEISALTNYLKLTSEMIKAPALRPETWVWILILLTSVRT